MKYTNEFVKDNLSWIEESMIQLITLSTKYEMKELYYLIGDNSKDNERICKRISRKIEQYFLDNKIHFNKN